MGDLPLGQLQTGCSYDFVGEVTASDGGRLLWTGEPFVVSGFSLRQGVHTFYDFVFVGSVEGRGIFRPGMTALAVLRPCLSAQAFAHLRDICSGLGGIAVGASKVGVSTVLHVDKSALAVRTVRNNGGHALHGDIASREVQRAIHMACPDLNCLLSAGIPCQSYSVQGSGGGLQDPRGMVLFSVLRVAWLTQAVGLVLECVSEIQGHKDTMQVLSDFGKVAGLQVHQVILELNHQWPSRRKRWWCVMLPASNPFCISPWPVDPRYAIVGSCLSSLCGHWPMSRLFSGVRMKLNVMRTQPMGRTLADSVSPLRHQQLSTAGGLL